MAKSPQAIADRLRVDLAHKLANVLLLPPQRAMRLDRARLSNGLQQYVLQWQAVEIRLLDSNQFFTEFLQGHVVALAGAFAGL